jgi:hypothetical protein
MGKMLPMIEMNTQEYDLIQVLSGFIKFSVRELTNEFSNWHGFNLALLLFIGILLFFYLNQKKYRKKMTYCYQGLIRGLMFFAFFCAFVRIFPGIIGLSLMLIDMTGRGLTIREALEYKTGIDVTSLSFWLEIIYFFIFYAFFGGDDILFLVESEKSGSPVA